MRFILLFFVLMLFACGEGAYSSGSYSDDLELNYNYMLLRAFFYRPERIKDYSEYKGMEVDSMYSSLNDILKGGRYTYYLPPSKADDKIHDMQNTPKYYSFGFERDTLIKDTLVVTAVYPISPAASVLKKRDKLLYANEISLTGADAKKYLKTDSLFAASTEFTVLRNGKEEVLLAIQKAEVQEPTVYLDSLDGYNIPFITVTQYKHVTNDPNGTYAEFKNVLQEIKGAKTAIMDLRRNPGGSIYHCTAMAAELAPLNSELVYDVEHYYDKLRGNVIDTVRYFASDFLESEGDGVDIKWIVLISGGSASCAERFAVALRSSRPETVIIGQTSFGKGIGQIYTKTYLGGLAYITCLQSFYPNGDPFHIIGVEPDILTNPNDPNETLMAALQAAQSFDPDLARRSPIPFSLGLSNLPPERKAAEIEPGMYKEFISTF
ncbi:MAG: hypothetical protein LBU89_10650 [Fibromonadaceae bacterium]|jgi:C-terminal processing protease CtpA/Prc|nr:hypothetical protein [Fibromonadaceae bacterium]